MAMVDTVYWLSVGLVKGRPSLCAMLYLLNSFITWTGWLLQWLCH